MRHLAPAVRRHSTALFAGALLALFAVNFSGLPIVGPHSAEAAPEKTPAGIRFTFTDPNAGSVSVAGAFNGWNATANPMVKGEGGVWSAVVALPPGEQQYKFVVDGQWIADPENPVTGGDFGNSVIRLGPDGDIQAQVATSNTPYSPRILIDGRTIARFIERYDTRFDRYELDRPWFDIDLGFNVRISDLLKARVLFNVNPATEDVQDYRSRLNYKRGSLLLSRPGVDILAFDSETIGTWDDPLHLVGNIGVFSHPFGFNRSGMRVTGRKFGMESEVQFSDNIEDRNQAIWPRYRDYTIDNFPTYVIGPSNQPRYVFETDPIGTAIALLRTEREGSGFAIAPNQASKVQAMDFGDDGERFGSGDSFEDVFAARLRRPFGGGLRVGVLGRTDRGFNLGRMILAQPTGDSTVRVHNTLFSQQWYGGGVDAQWKLTPNARVYAEVLAGARRMNFVNGSTTVTYAVDSLLATRVVVDPASAVTANVDGDHLMIDESKRFTIGGSYEWGHKDITLRGRIERDAHTYPAWSQAPIAAAGQPPADHPRFETVDFQRAAYTGTDRDLENSATTFSAGFDRNWRYYLNREVISRLDVEWTNFEYDARTAWESQLWFPTGNLWLENGGHLVTVDRLTMLGEDQAIRVKPVIEIPLQAKRAMRLTYRGTFSTVALERNPRYAETRIQYGFDLTRTLRFNSDTRWAKYDAPALSIGRGYLSTFAEIVLRPAPSLQVSFGYGVDPRVLDPVTNEYADIGRDQFLFDRNANGFIAETNYLSLAPQIAQGEQTLQDERRFQVQAIIRF